MFERASYRELSRGKQLLLPGKSANWVGETDHQQSVSSGTSDPLANLGNS
jgi:hypothetical protein